MSNDRMIRSQYPGAEALARESLALCEKHFGTDPFNRSLVLSLLGQTLLAQQKYAAAEAHLLEAYERLKAYEGLSQREREISGGEDNLAALGRQRFQVLILQR